MKRLLPLLLLPLAACTTPMTIMKNPKTGQISTCGGSATGSFVGGIVGYEIQKSNDSACVQEYMKQGFKTEVVRE